MRKTLIIIMLMLLLCGCQADDSLSAVSTFRSDTNYSDYANIPANTYDKLFSEQNINYRILNRQELASIACMGELPDVVLTDINLAGVLYKYSLVHTLDKNIIQNNTDIDACTRYGQVFAFPAPNRSFSVVIYDSKKIESFPDSLDKLMSEGESAKGKGYDALIAWSDSDGSSSIDCVLGPRLAAEKNSTEYLSGLSKGEGELTDDIMQSSLEDALKIMSSDVFSKDFSKMTKKTAVKAFCEGKYPAIMTTDPYKTLEDIEKEDPKLYARLQFAALPVTNDKVYVPYETRYCFVIASQNRTDESVKLCQQLIAEYENKVNEIPKKNDATLDRLEKYKNSIEGCFILTLRLHPIIWKSCGEDIVRAGKSNIDKRETTKLMQQNYEEYFFPDNT